MRVDRRLVLLLLPLVAWGCKNDSYEPEPEGLALRFAVAGPQAVSQAETSALAAAFDIVDRYVVEIVDDANEDFVTSADISVAPGLQAHNLEITVPEDALGRTVRITVIAYAGDTELYRAVTVTTLSETISTTEVALEVRYTGPGIRGVVVDDFGVGLPDASVSLFQGESMVEAVQTEPDGTYLFLDVPLGQYQLLVAPSGQFTDVCPPARDLTVSTIDAAIVADFLATGENCGNSVLIVSGGDFDDTPAVESMLASDPTLTTGSWFFVSQTPGLEELRAHDVVLLFTNGLFNESVSLGDEIAQYVNEGGNVVIASFYWQVRSGSPLGATWGALEALDPFTSDGGARYQPGDLGSVDEPNHPLAAGVGVVTSTGFWGGVTAKPNTNVVASWVNGDPFIGYDILAGGQRVVGVSLFPASGTSATGDWQQVFLNAVSWAGSAGGPVPE